MSQPYPPQPPGWAGQAPSGYGHPASPPGGQPPPQPGQAPPGYPAQPPQAAPQGAGQSGMALTLKYHPMTFMLGLMTPVVMINGQRVQAKWGRNELPMPPGQYHVHVHVPYMIPRRIGKADSMVPLQPGQIVEAEYRAPLWVYASGSLGPVPQSYKGMGVMLAVWGVAIVLFALFSIPMWT